MTAKKSKSKKSAGGDTLKMSVNFGGVGISAVVKGNTLHFRAKSLVDMVLLGYNMHLMSEQIKKCVLTDMVNRGILPPPPEGFRG